MSSIRRLASLAAAAIATFASTAAAAPDLDAASSLPPPPNRGACCLPNGTCTVVTQNQCNQQGGTYRGNGTSCSPNPCTPPPPPTGACCLSSGACSILTQTQCTQQSGSYRGNGTVCSPNPCPQPPPGVALHGVLIAPVSDPNCTRFESDTGDSYILNSSGSFIAGDRIYVEGTVPQSTAGVCVSELTPFITVSNLKPGFAGIGTLVLNGGQTCLQTDDGRIYSLQNAGGLPLGSRVYTQGWIDTAQSPTRISANSIGAAYSGFGRLLGTPPGDLRFQGEDGVTYILDRVAAHHAIAADYVYVEGILGAPASPRPITSATARFAFSTSGTVVDDGAGGHALQADGVIVDDVFTVSGLGAFALGAKAYVRGLATDDYDSGEPRSGNSIRQPRVAAAYTAVGTFHAAGGTVTNIDDNTLITLENTAGFPDGVTVYVAGTLAASGPGTVTLGHNLILPAYELNGTLQIGFECAPLFVSPSGVFFLENTGGFAINDNVTVRGGVARFIAPCEFDCFVNNSIILGLPDR